MTFVVPPTVSLPPPKVIASPPSDVGASTYGVITHFVPSLAENKVVQEDNCLMSEDEVNEFLVPAVLKMR